MSIVGACLSHKSPMSQPLRVYFSIFRTPRVLRLCMHCLEWPIRIKILPKEDKNSKNNACKLCIVQNCVNLCKYESPAEELVLKTERYAQRLPQGYST